MCAGHLVSAYSIQINFSPCGTYLMSGDADGYMCIWDWKSTKMYRYVCIQTFTPHTPRPMNCACVLIDGSKIKAHDGVCVGLEWNPNEPSRVATCGWDGLIKYWD